MCSMKSLFVALALAVGSGLAGAESKLDALFQKSGLFDDILLRPLAMKGDARAQFNLGVMYANGIGGVAKDDREAVFWWLKAAEQGHAKAQATLGNRYSEGVGVAKDEQQAIFWYRKAAEQGLDEPQFILALSYDIGRGVPKDYRQAVFWYRKAAEQGHAHAQFGLGSMYASGRGLRKDDQQAGFWYRKSAEQGLAHAQHFLGHMYANGEGVPKDAQQAVHWYRKSAEQGYARAQIGLGIMYAQGRGVTKDDQQAYFWWLLASVGDGNDAIASRDLRDTLEPQLSSEQRAAAQADARNWKPQVANSLGTAPGSSDPERKGRPDSTGSGFRVAAGKIVTNNHVVADCSRVRVNGAAAARVLARDSKNDIALLVATGDQGAAAAVRATRSRLGEEIAVAGFPLQSLLSGLSVTQGSVSRLSGLAGDTRLLQISAPVQPGNSGGPLLDASASVIGVVVSKLDALRVAKATGDIPQNVNFALNANVLRGFLDANDVQYADGASAKPLARTEVASRAARFTVLVECWK
jgi:uncharacterized protein